MLDAYNDITLGVYSGLQITNGKRLILIRVRE